MNPPQVYMCSPSWTLLPPPSPYHPLFNCLINRTLGYLAMILQVWFMTHLHQNDPGKLVVNTPTTGFLESAFLMSSLVNPYTYWSLKISHSNAHFCPNFRLSFFFFFCLLLLLLLSRFSCVQLYATPWTAAHQAPPSVGFSRQEYWSGVPLPSPFFCLLSSFWKICLHLEASLPPVAKENRPALFHLSVFKVTGATNTYPRAFRLEA